MHLGIHKKSKSRSKNPDYAYACEKGLKFQKRKRRGYDDDP